MFYGEIQYIGQIVRNNSPVAIIVITLVTHQTDLLRKGLITCDFKTSLVLGSLFMGIEHTTKFVHTSGTGSFASSLWVAQSLEVNVFDPGFFKSGGQLIF